MPGISSRQVVSTCKSIRDTLWCTRWTYQGIKLMSGDNYRVVHCFTLMWILWAEALNGSAIDYMPLLSEWLRHVPRDVKTVIDTLKAADALILSNWENDRQQLRWREFKAHLKGIVCDEAGAILAPLKPLYPCVFLNHESDYARVRSFRTCLLFCSRLTLEGDNLPFEQEAAAKWLQTEERISGSNPAPEPKEFFDRYLSGWSMTDVRDTDLEHGSGVCSDANRNMFAKYAHFGIDGGVLRFMEETGVTWPIHGVLPCHGKKNPVRSVSAIQQLRTSLQGFVPKAYDKKRVINAETAECMFMQKGVQNSIYRYVKRHPHLSRHCMVDDNSLNRAFCYHASRDGSLCTIDLSEASDSVTRKHLVKWTKDTALLKAWWYTCSRSVKLPDGQIYRPRKAFSMGSAICFPYEIFCFAAIVESCIRAHGMDPKESFYVIHGDDIIVETALADAVCTALEENGFLVNREKSFFGTGKHIFRESCGVEYLDGHDVKPMRISRRFFTTIPPKGGLRFDKRFPDWVPRYVDLANRAFGVSKWLRSYLINEIKANGVHVAFTNNMDDSAKIFTTVSNMNYHLQTATITYGSGKDSWSETYKVYDRFQANLGYEDKTPINRVTSSDGVLPPYAQFWLYEILRRMEINSNRMITTDMVDPDRVIMLSALPWNRKPVKPEKAGRLVRTRLDGELE